MLDEADTVLAQVGLTYRGLNANSDRGFMESRDDPDSAETDTRKITLSTHFRRPNLFRFEWTCSDLEGVNAIWCDGENAFEKCRYESKARRVKNLSAAIAGATGISGGTAHTVSSLLMEEVSGRKLTDMKNTVYKEPTPSMVKTATICKELTENSKLSFPKRTLLFSELTRIM